jgi:hypothetical protein
VRARVTALVRVEDYYRSNGVEILGGEGYVEAFADFGDLERFVGFVGEEVGAGYVAWEFVEVEGTGGPGEDFDVDLVGGGGGAPVPGGDELGFAVAAFFCVAEGAGGDVEEGGLGVVDGFAVDAEPLAHLLEALDLGSGDNPVGIRADVEEIVAAFAGDVDEIAEEGLGGLEVGVEGFVAPGVVHGHAGLPVAARVALGGDELFGGLGIAFVGSAEAVVPNEIGVLVEDLDDLGGALGSHLARSVEPDDNGILLVVVEELFDLGDGFLVEVVVEAAVLRGVPVTGLGIVSAADCCGAAGCGPILRLRVVEAEFDALFAALFGEFAEWVAFEGSRGDDVEGIDLGVEHGEAVVVFGGDDDVLHAGGFGQGDDVVRAEASGVEVFREGFVVGDGDGEVVHDPLADVGGALAVPLAGGDGVEAPVDEHAEAGFAPPLHSGVALGRGFGVLDGGDGMVDRRCVGLGAFELRVAPGRGGDEKCGGDAAVRYFQVSSSGRSDGRGIIGENIYLLVQI